MRAFTLTELSRMQGAQEGAMQDQGAILHYVAGVTDEYGMPVSVWVEGPVTECGYDGQRRQEAGVPAGTPDTQVELTDGRLRLPIDTTISRLDRFELTQRFGVMLETPVVFELMGEPRRGPSGLLVDVRRVTNG